MIRLTRKVFTDLAIWMIGLGLLMGLIFPFFATAMRIPSAYVLTPLFFAACAAAGFAVGAANISLAWAVVGRRLSLLANRMRYVEANLLEMAQGGDLAKCTPDQCSISVDSEDEIGESAQAFNSLVQTLSLSLRTEAAVREFTEMLASQLELNVLTDKALQQLLQHVNARAGAILIEADGEMKVAVSQGIRSPNAIVGSDHVRRALRAENWGYSLSPASIL